MKKIEELKKFAENVRIERLKRRLSQDKFAELIGIKQAQHISSIEKGEVDIKLSTVLSILDVLDCKLEDLLS